MRFVRQIMLVALVFACAAALAGDDGFRPLFNGKDLEGWEGDAKLFSAENGEIVGKSTGIKQNEFLASKEDFKDFVLLLKFKLVDKSEGKGGMVNSGMQFRSQRVPKSSEMKGYQADIGEGWWGCIYDESRRNKVLMKPDAEALKKAMKPGDWNEYKLTCDGAHIVLELNGAVMCDYTEADPPEKAARDGKFGIQIHSGAAMEIHVKDLKIKELNK